MLLIAASVWLTGWQPPSSATSVFAFSSVGSVVIVFLATKGTGISAPRIYAMCLWAFHSPLLVLATLGVPIHEYTGADLIWFYDSDIISRAAAAVALGQFAFATGVVIARGRRPRKVPLESPSGGGDGRNAMATALAGACALVLGLLIWLGVAIASFGLSFILVPYKQWLEAASGSKLWLAYLLITLGMAALGGGYETKLSKRWLVIFIAWALPAFLMGLRGEALFPLLAYLAARSHIRPVRMGLQAFGALVAVLSLGVLAKWIRQVGLGSFQPGSGSVNPLEGLVETGYSLFVTYQVVLWHEIFGEAFVGLKAWVGPAMYPLQVLGLNAGPAPEEYSLNLAIGSRIGQLGGSVIAEGYRSMGMIGVALFLLMIGCLISWLTRLPKSPRFASLVGGTAGVLLIAVRNDSVPVVISLVLLVALLAVAEVFQRTLGNR
jgi:hypothetical protein